MLIDHKLFEIEESAKGVLLRTKNAKQSFLLKEKRYYKELAELTEALKAEGWWNGKGRISISNKNPNLMRFFESLLNFHKIKVSKILNVKVKIPKKWKAEKIKLYKNNQPKKFHLGKNGFTGKKDRIVFWDKFCSSEYLLAYKNEKIRFSTQITQENFSTDFAGAFVYCAIRASNKSFTTFLNRVLKEKTHSNKIRVSKYLKNSSKEIIVSVFATLVDCEGSIRLSGLNRSLRIRMKNQEYLNDWHLLLENIGIKSRTEKNKLTITSYQNFKKLAENGFCLNHNDKRTRFEKILSTYKKYQLKRNTALDFYLMNLKELSKEISATEFAKKVNKNKRVVLHFLKKLEKENLVNVNKNSMTYLYSAKAEN